MSTKNSYADILHLPHHVSDHHPHMPVADRAAQFAPFAALTGHKEAVKEKARLTDEKIELDEDCRAVLDGKIQILQEVSQDQQGERPKITITYFVRDQMKDGGSYESVTGVFKKIDEYTRTVVMADGKRILLEEIVSIDGDLFNRGIYSFYA